MVDDVDELVDVVRAARVAGTASLSIACVLLLRIAAIRRARARRVAPSRARAHTLARSLCPTPLSRYHGNVVDVWERFAEHAEATGECLVELGSDQTSLHNPYNGGYYPAGMTWEEAQTSMADHPAAFKAAVQDSLRRHVAAVNAMAARGTVFWDYGNAFLLESERAEAAIRVDDAAQLAALPDGHSGFKYESYVCRAAVYAAAAAAAPAGCALRARAARPRCAPALRARVAPPRGDAPPCCSLRALIRPLIAPRPLSFRCRHCCSAGTSRRSWAIFFHSASAPSAGCARPTTRRTWRQPIESLRRRSSASELRPIATH